MTDLEKDPAVIEATSEVNALSTIVSNYAVATQEQFVAGADDLKRVKAAQKKLEDTRTSITGPINESLRRVNAFFKKPADALVAFEQKIKAALGRYADEQERIRLEEQRRADEAARKEREKLEAQARRAAESGKVEKAAALDQRAATVVAPVIQREAPRVSGVTMREVWKFEITDPSLVPREYCTPDEKKIRAVVQGLKGDAKIAGVRIYPDKQIASSAA
jgi:hypothetical protein